MANVCAITQQLDSNGVVIGECVTCPEVPAVAGSPAQVIVDPRLGWNTSARSIDVRDGDFYTQFGIPPSVGVVCGFASAHPNRDPANIEHGFYAHSYGGAEYFVVIERGAEKTVRVARVPATDVFRIERRVGVVRYFRNGRQIYVSATPSTGAKMIVACMYSAEDGVD